MSEKLANKGITVVAALDSTFQRKAFNDIINLVPLAEKVSKLSAVCVGCSGKAYFTERIIDGEELEVIGGEESYRAVCRKCFNASENKKKSPQKR